MPLQRGNRSAARLGLFDGLAPGRSAQAGVHGAQPRRPHLPRRACASARAASPPGVRNLAAGCRPLRQLRRQFRPAPQRACRTCDEQEQPKEDPRGPVGPHALRGPLRNACHGEYRQRDLPSSVCAFSESDSLCASMASTGSSSGLSCMRIIAVKHLIFIGIFDVRAGFFGAVHVRLPRVPIRY